MGKCEKINVVPALSAFFVMACVHMAYFLAEKRWQGIWEGWD